MHDLFKINKALADRVVKKPFHIGLLIQKWKKWLIGYNQNGLFLPSPALVSMYSYRNVMGPAVPISHLAEKKDGLLQLLHIYSRNPATLPETSIQYRKTAPS